MLIQIRSDTHSQYMNKPFKHPFFTAQVLTGGLIWQDDKTQQQRKMACSAFFELHLTKTQICGMHDFISIN